MATTPAKKAAAKPVAPKKVAPPAAAPQKAAPTVASKKVPAKKVAAPKPAEKPVPKVEAKTGVKAVPAKVAKPVKLKVKLVRDSFTMPADDWALIDQLKARAIGFKRPAKKSELLRAGLQVLAGLPDAALQAALDKLQPLKPGRPKADKK